MKTLLFGMFDTIFFNITFEYLKLTLTIAVNNIILLHD